MDKGLCNYVSNSIVGCLSIGSNWEGNGQYIAFLIPKNSAPIIHNIKYVTAK